MSATFYGIIAVLIVVGSMAIICGLTTTGPEVGMVLMTTVVVPIFLANREKNRERQERTGSKPIQEPKP